jgi:hypothetical protein
MEKQTDIFDDYYYLNENGIRLIKLALQDTNEAKRLFRYVREGTKTDTKKFQGLSEQVNELPTIENPTLVLKTLTTILLGFAQRYNSDQILILDLIEIINSNNLDNKKSIIELAKALSKNKEQMDEAIRVVIEKYNKNEDKIKDAIRSLNEQGSIVKWVKRDLDSKSKVVGENNDE